MDKVLILMRGIPGSGKSTVSKILDNGLENSVILSTDDFFMIEGEYKFDPTRLKENHEANQTRALKACLEGKNIIIDNTNIKAWQLEPYLEIVSGRGYKVYQVAVLEQQEVAFQRQTHKVPEEAHKRMNEDLVNSIKEEFSKGPVPENTKPLYINEETKI